ncbi:MAG: marine proteobacterial sortase target protein [Agarilytica sp.]
MCFGKRKTPKHLIIEDFNFRKRQTRGLIWIGCALLMLIGSMAISISAQATEEIDESKAGQLLFQNKYGLYEAALHLESQAKVKISGMTAHITLSQSFSNITNEWQEGVYVFPLPENSAVNHMELQIGERIIVGEIKEKQQAKKMYQKAKSEGKRAALTEQNRPNIFTQRVANIPPHEDIKVSITYVQTIEYRDNEFSWKLPMTITPRYFPHTNTKNEVKKNSDFDSSQSIQVSQDKGWATGTASMDAWPLPSTIHSFHDLDIKNPIRIDIELDSGLPLAELDSLHHQVHINKNDDVHKIELTQGIANMDRDFILRWQPLASDMPQAAIFSEEINGDFYSTVMVLPPKTEEHANDYLLPRDVMFIIDTSGSMAGASIKQAKSSLIKALTRLHERDRFNIIEFDSNFTALFPELKSATNHNINDAKRWAKKLHADGGTEMLPAFNAALLQLHESSRDSHNLQQTIFITDGAVSNEVQLFKTIRNQIGDSRLFTVGIGSAPNSFFMRKAAEFGRGTFTFISQLNHVESKMNQLFDKLGSAVATNIQLTWPGNAEIYPERISDLYLNEAIVVSAKSEDLKGDIEVSGITASMPWRQYLNLDKHKPNSGVSSIWARSKIENLQDLKVSGGNPDVIKQEITDIALRHKLLSPYTSFVAIEKKIARPEQNALKTSPILNATPAGHTNTKKSTPYPSTASSAALTWWLGLLLSCSGLVFYRMRED